MLRKKLHLFSVLLLLIVVGVASGQATRVMGDGADVEKIVIGIIGDGYTPDEMPEFEDDVNRLVVQGLFEDDVFSEFKEAFSVYRLDVPSSQSGVSTPGSHRDTAIGLVFNDDWEQCWFNETPVLTNDRIKGFFGQNFYDYVLVIANTGVNRGGCHPGGNRLYVSNRVSPTVIAHEFGHSLAGLFDEYTSTKFIAHLSSDSVNYNNCSNKIDRSLLIWSAELTANIGIPTLSFPDGVDSDQAVGMFEGCRYATKGLFRPMWNCRMKDPYDNIPFCKVCGRLLRYSMKRLIKLQLHHELSPAQEFLKLELKLTPEDSEILKFSRFTTTDGTAPVISPTSNFIFEFSGGGKTISVGSLGQDPFEVRSFPDLKNNRGELLPKKESVTIVVNIPISEGQDLKKENLKLNFYEIKPGVLTDKNMFVNMDQPKLNKLKTENLLKKSTQVTTQDFKSVKISNF